ncbi:12208_t:CDS:2, partial [Ambispora gerdemannii]
VEDAVYDKHLKELQGLEALYNFVFPNSPAQKTGYPSSNQFHPVVRQNPMLSLDSVNNQEGLFRFDERPPVSKSSTNPNQHPWQRN